MERRPRRASGTDTDDKRRAIVRADTPVVGNDGFSLRSERLLERLARSDVVRPAGTPEDWFICVTVREMLERDGIRFAPPGIAHEFSFEGDELFGVSWHGQFGFHGLHVDRYI